MEQKKKQGAVSYLAPEMYSTEISAEKGFAGSEGNLSLDPPGYGEGIDL